jgi:hypothetical protein
MKVNISSVGKSKVVLLLVNYQLLKQNKPKVNFTLVKSKLKRSRKIHSIAGILLNIDFNRAEINCINYDLMYGKGEAIKALSSLKIIN